jgi:hypothetical protein
MKYLFNDVEVTKEKYEALCNEAAINFGAISLVQETKVEVTPARKVASRVVTSSGKSKIEQACEIVAELDGKLTRDQIITQLMLSLGDISKGNATIYYKKALAKDI